MDRLRELFSELGFSDVSTFIASGNVIFTASSDDSATLEAKIESHLERALGCAVPTFIRSPAELAVVAGLQPTAAWGEAAEHGAVYVTFLREPAEPEFRQRLVDLSSDTDEFRFSGREVLWLVRGKVSDSPLFGSAITKATAGVAHTMRNMTSIRKLVAKHGGEWPGS